MNVPSNNNKLALYLWRMNAKESLRILSIVPYKIFPAVMGGQKGIALFYKYLSKQVSFACFTVKSNEANEGYTILNQMPNATSRYINPLLFFKVKKLALDNECTHILFEHPYYAWLIFLLKLFTPIQIILHSHNIESERFKSIGKWWWKILWYYERWAHKHASTNWFKTEEDKNYAQIYFKLPERTCYVIPYGVELNALPTNDEIFEAKKIVQHKHNIQANETILLFNGTLHYKPNADALVSILHQINPLLLKEDIAYKIIICGKGLPSDMLELKEYANQNIVYAGFVDDIDIYFKACDIFLNPLQDGGGIKTKLVEALGFGKKCVSSANGAIGVKPESCGGRLRIVADKDWKAYKNAILELMQTDFSREAHHEFYRTYAWSQIAEKALATLVP